MEIYPFIAGLPAFLHLEGAKTTLLKLQGLYHVIQIHKLAAAPGIFPKHMRLDICLQQLVIVVAAMQFLNPGALSIRTQDLQAVRL